MLYDLTGSGDVLPILEESCPTRRLLLWEACLWKFQKVTSMQTRCRSRPRDLKTWYLFKAPINWLFGGPVWLECLSAAHLQTSRTFCRNLGFQAPNVEF